MILSGSPRKGGNSDLLCDEFMRGAREAGHEAKKIRVAEKKIGCCSACYIRNNLRGYRNLRRLFLSASRVRVRYCFDKNEEIIMPKY